MLIFLTLASSISIKEESRVSHNEKNKKLTNYLSPITSFFTPLYLFLQYGDETNLFAADTVPKEKINEYFFKVDQGFFDEKWVRYSSLVSCINTKLRLRAIFYGMGYTSQNITSISNFFENLTNCLDMNIKTLFSFDDKKEERILDILKNITRNWNNISNIFTAINLKQENFKNALDYVISNKLNKATLNGIFKRLYINTDEYVNAMKEVYDLVNNTKTDIGSILDYFNVQQKTFNDILRIITTTFSDDYIENTSTKKLIALLSRMIFKVFECITNKVLKIILSLVSTSLFSLQHYSLAERSEMLSKGFEGITQLGNEGKLFNTELTSNLVIIFHNFSTTGVNMSAFSGEESLFSVISNIIKGIGNESINAYGIVDSILSYLYGDDHAVNKFFETLRKSNSNINELLTQFESIDNTTVNFLLSATDIANKSLSLYSIHYFMKLLKTMETDIEEEFKRIKQNIDTNIPLSELGTVLNYYKEKKELIPENLTVILSSCIKTFMKIFNVVATQMKKRKKFANAFQSALISVKTTEAAPFINYCLYYMKEKLSKNDEYASFVEFIDEVSNKFNESLTLYLFFSKCQNIDYSKVSYYFNNLSMTAEIINALPFASLISELSENEGLEALVKVFTNFYNTKYSLSEFALNTLGFKVKPDKVKKVLNDTINFLLDGIIPIKEEESKSIYWNNKLASDTLKRIAKCLSEDSIRYISYLNYDAAIDILNIVKDEAINNGNMFLVLLSKAIEFYNTCLSKINNGTKISRFTKVIDDKIDIRIIGEIFGDFANYSYSLYNGKSVIQLIGKSTNTNAEGLIEPYKNALASLHKLFFERCSALETCGYLAYSFSTYSHPSSSWQLTKTFCSSTSDEELRRNINSCMNLFFKKDYSIADKDKIISFSDSVVPNMVILDNVFDNNFSLSYMVDNNEFFFKDIFKAMSANIASDMNISACLKGIVVDNINIIDSINSLDAIQTLNIINTGDALVLANQKSNGISEFCGNISLTSSTRTVDKLSSLYGYDLTKVPDEIINNTMSPISFLEEETYLAVIQNIKSITNYSSSGDELFTIDSFKQMIQRFLSSHTDDYTATKVPPKKLSNANITLIVIGTAVVVSIIISVVLFMIEKKKYKTMNNNDEFTLT